MTDPQVNADRVLPHAVKCTPKLAQGKAIRNRLAALRFFPLRQWGDDILTQRKYWGIVALACIMPLSFGCETAKRLAPPGFVKYEDKEKGIPPNPAIQKRIDERTGNSNSETGSDGAQQRYPDLTQAPTQTPQGMTPEQRTVEMDTLLQARDESDASIAAARTQMENEFGLSTLGDIRPNTENNPNLVEEFARELDEALATDKSAIEAEAKDPLPEPLETPEAPAPEEPF